MNTIPEMTNEERDAFNYPFHHTPSSVAQAGVVLVGYILRVEQYLEERRMSAASNVNPEFPLYPSLSEEGASSKLTAVRIAELEAQLTAAQERERWIPVTERLPKMGKEVLACFDGQVTSSGIVFGSIWQGLRHTLPTHWRELPAPPQEAADAE